MLGKEQQWGSSSTSLANQKAPCSVKASVSTYSVEGDGGWQLGFAHTRVCMHMHTHTYTCEHLNSHTHNFWEKQKQNVPSTQYDLLQILQNTYHTINDILHKKRKKKQPWNLWCWTANANFIKTNQDASCVKILIAEGTNLAQRCIPTTQVPGRLRQEGCVEETSLCYLASSRSPYSTKQKPPQRKQKHTTKL